MINLLLLVNPALGWWFGMADADQAVTALALPTAPSTYGMQQACTMARSLDDLASDPIRNPLLSRTQA